MDWREFIAEMTGHLAWPFVACALGVVLLVTQRAAITGFIRRSRKVTYPGGHVEADAALADAVADAVEPTPSVKEISASKPEVIERDTQERREQVERLVREAARWGQELAEATPPRAPGMGYWIPTVHWSGDGRPSITVGTRKPLSEEPIDITPELRAEHHG